MCRDTGSKKASEEGTEAELSLSVNGTLDLAAGGDHCVETGRELGGSAAVNLTSDTGISRDLCIGVQRSANGGDTLDDGHRIGVGEVQASLGLDLSLERHTNASTGLESALDTGADARKLALETSNDAGGELTIGLEARRAAAGGRGGGRTLTLARKRAEKTTDHALTRARGRSRLLASEATSKSTKKTSTARSAGLAEAEGTALELAGLLDGSGRGHGDKGRKSESVVNHCVGIKILC